MSWSYDTGTISQTFTVQGGQQSTGLIGMYPITLSDSDTFFVSAGTLTGTAAVEKVESVRVRIAYRINGFQDSRNFIAFSPGGLNIKAPGQPASGGVSTFPPELVLRGAEAHVGPDAIDTTFTPDGVYNSPSINTRGNQIFNPSGWIDPQLRIDMTSYGTLSITITRLQLDITTTYVGIDPTDNDNSARPEALDGDLTGVGFRHNATSTGSGGSATTQLTRGPNYTWAIPPPNNALFDTNYTARIDHISLEALTWFGYGGGGIDIRSANRNPYASTLTANPLDNPGVLTVRLKEFVNGDYLEGTTGVFSVGGNQVNSFDINLIHGAVEFTFQFKADGITTGDVVVLEISRPNGSAIERLYHWVDLTPANLSFTDQPVTTTEVGLPFGTVAVAFVDANGDIITGSTDNITLEAFQEDGATPPLNGTLQGTLTVAAVAGVATFSDLTFDGVGIIKLKATSGTNIPTFSNPINVLGFPIPSTVTGLRQNLAEDGSLWVKVTGVATPSYSTPTDAEKHIIDGDNAVEDSVTTDGFRWRFKYPFILRSVFMRGLLSNLNLAPTIEVYTSTDTTTGQNGTWTLLTTFTPSRVNVFQRVSFPNLTPTSPAIRGLWVTLNDQGGTATMAWKAIHVAGMYLGAPFAYGDRAQGTLIQDEEIITIPRVGAKLFGAANVTRELFFQNTLGKSTTITVSQAAARFGGDTLADSNNFDIEDTDGTSLTGGTLGATGQLPYNHDYDITTSDNDGSGLHLSRVTVRRQGEPIVVTGYPESSSFDIIVRTLLTGDILFSYTYNTSTQEVKWFVHESEAELYVADNTVRPFIVDVYSLDTGFLLRQLSVDDASITNTVKLAGICVTANGDLVISTDDNSTGDDLIVANRLTGAFVSSVSLSGTTPQQKPMAPYTGDLVCVCQGSGGGAFLWEVINVRTGVTSYTMDPDADTNRTPLATISYDAVNDYWRMPAAFSTQIEWLTYNASTGAFIGETSPMSPPAPAQTGDTPFSWVDPVTAIEYVFWEWDVLFSGPIGDYGNHTLVYDLGLDPFPDIGSTDGGGTAFGRANVAVPGYFAGATLIPADIVGNLDDGLAVEDLNFALVLNEASAPVTERYTTWGLAADAGVLYQNLNQPNLLIIGDAGIIYVLDNERPHDDGAVIPLHFRTGPVPQSTANTDVHTFRRFHSVSWETASTPPAQGWYTQLQAWDVDDQSNVYTTSFTQFQKEVRVKIPLRARQIIIEWFVNTTTDYNPVGMQLRFQNTPRPLRGYN